MGEEAAAEVPAEARQVRALVRALDQAQAQVVQVVHQVEVAAAPGTQGKHADLDHCTCFF